MQHPGARRSLKFALGLCALLALSPAARADEPTAKPALRATLAQAHRDLYASHLAQLLAQHPPPAEDWLWSAHVFISSQQALLRSSRAHLEAPGARMRAQSGIELPVAMFSSLKRCVQLNLMRRLRLSEDAADALASALEHQAVETAGLDPATYLARTGQRRIAEPLRLARIRLALDQTQRLTAGRVDSSYDIPYVAGYDARDGTRVYIDRLVPLEKVLPGSALAVPIGRLITLHELVEKAMLDEFQLTYPQAHQLALRVEREATLALHFSWETYDRYMEGVIDEVGRRRPERVPPGLDLTPYESYSDPETVALRLQMQRAQMQRPIAAP